MSFIFYGMDMTVSWFLVAVLILVQIQSKICSMQYSFTSEPSDVKTVLGSKIQLFCATAKNVSVRWIKNEEILTAKSNQDISERYKFITDGEGNFTLEINPVILRDEGIFQCQINLEEKPVRNSRFANVTVLVPPRPPKILQGNVTTSSEGMDLVLICVSPQGKPPSKIIWVNERNGKILRRSKEIVNVTGSLFTVKSTLRLKVERRLHNNKIACRTKNEAESTYKSTNILIQVSQSLNTRVEFKSGRNELGWIPEGSDVSFKCEIEGFFPESTIEWMLNYKLLVGKKSEYLRIRNVSRVHHNGAVSCVGKNKMEKSIDTVVLSISYGPTFRSKPNNTVVELGDSVSLFCDADGNPNPVISWIYKGNKTTDVLVGKSSNLTLGPIFKNSAGIYLCRAFVPGYPEIEHEFRILVKNSHTIIVSSDHQKGALGEEATLKCTAVSTLSPLRSFWNFHGHKINQNDKNYLMREEVFSNKIETTLTIPKLLSNHSGTYSCIITAGDISNSSEVILEIQDSHFSAVGLGAVGFLLGVVILMTGLSVFFGIERIKKRTNFYRHHRTPSSRFHPSGFQQHTSQVSRIGAECATGAVRGGHSCSSMPRNLIKTSGSLLYPNSHQSTFTCWPQDLGSFSVLPEQGGFTNENDEPSGNSIYVKVGENNISSEEPKNNIYMEISENPTGNDILLCDIPQFSETLEFFNPTFYEKRNRFVNIHPTYRGMVRQLRFQSSCKKLPPIMEEFVLVQETEMAPMIE